MVEVFRTNVLDQEHATRLLGHIHHTFREYHANFDLEDCDKILRVASATGLIQATGLIHLVQGLGFEAEVLPD